MDKIHLSHLAKRVPGVKGLVAENEEMHKQLAVLQEENKLLAKKNLRLEKKLALAANKKNEIIWPLLKEDILKVDFEKKSLQKISPKEH